jgi:hypothetical protein
MGSVHRLFGASFSDAQLKRVTEAYDKAWKQIAGNYDEVSAVQARERLARAVFSIAPLAMDSDELAVRAIETFRARQGSSAGMHSQ